jgi:hypothetical protein
LPRKPGQPEDGVRQNRAWHPVRATNLPGAGTSAVSRHLSTSRHALVACGRLRCPHASMEIMNGYGESDDHRPVVWVRGHAIYAAHFVVIVFVLSMLVTTILMTANAPGLFAWLTFSSEAVFRGQIWRIFTYGLINPPSLWFVVDMAMTLWFGRELERFFGRNTFLLLYGCLYLLSPLLFTVIGVWRPMDLAGETGGFALFVAFATLYPNAVMLFNILAKWFALVLVGIYTLMALADRNLIQLITLWSTVGFAHVFVRFQQGRFTLPRFRWPRRQPRFRVLPGTAPKKAPAPNPPAGDMAEVDALLDKIAQSGIGSLTPKERAKLDAARDDLRRRASRS